MRAQREAHAFRNEVAVSGIDNHRDRVLIVASETPLRAMLRDYLEEEGYDVSAVETSAQAEQFWRAGRPDVVVVDCELPNGSGMPLLARLRAVDSVLPLIALTAYGSPEADADAVKLGAEQFLPKPAEPSTVGIVIQRSLENRRSRCRELAEKARRNNRAFDPFLGRSAKIRDLADCARRIASSDGHVLIQGEAGTGKGTLARWLHEKSPRAEEPFVDLNCRGISRDRLEIELFGYEGSASSQGRGKAAILEIAHKGTVFLDEILHLDLQTQAKLLRLLDEKQFRKLGEFHDRRADIRLVGGTQQTIMRAVRERRFSPDLAARISPSIITIPPLRDRLEDIPVLAANIVASYSSDLGTGEFQLTAGALSGLQSYSWPGNVRELRNVLERAVLVSTDSTVTEWDLHFGVQLERDLDGNGQFRTLKEIERRYIEQVLRKERGRVQSAARKLGIPRSSLYHKIKQYRIEHPGFGF